MKEVTYFQLGAKDPVLDKLIVLEIVKKYIPDASIVDYVDETGGEARTYSINNKIILKVQRPHRLRDKTSLYKEVFFLNELKKYNGINVPQVYGYGKYGDIEYICMSKISGKAVCYANLPLDFRKKVLFSLGKTLYKIHNMDILPFLDSKLFPNDKNYQGVKSRLDYEFNKKLKTLKNIDPLEIKYAQDLKNKLLSKIFKIEKLVPLHSNPAISHTFVDDDFKFSGLIDFGDALISHPVIDIKRWSLKDRQFVLKGYFSEENPSVNFQNILDVAFSLDNIIEILRNKSSVSFLNDLKELLVIDLKET